MDIQKLREVKFLGLAVFDMVSAIIGMILLFVMAWYWHFRNKSVVPFILAAILLAIPFGIVMHVLFGVNTALNRRLGLSN